MVGYKRMVATLDEREVLRNVRQTLSMQEAKVILLMREFPFQEVTVKMENGKVLYKKQSRIRKD